MLALASSSRMFYVGTFIAGVLIGMIIALKWTI
jgi:hypothetical protein